MFSGTTDSLRKAFSFSRCLFLKRWKDKNMPVNYVNNLVNQYTINVYRLLRETSQKFIFFR